MKYALNVVLGSDVRGETDQVFCKQCDYVMEVYGTVMEFFFAVDIVQKEFQRNPCRMSVQ
jgi:hypothetical protein